MNRLTTNSFHFLATLDSLLYRLGCVQRISSCFVHVEFWEGGTNREGVVMEGGD